MAAPRCSCWRRQRQARAARVARWRVRATRSSGVTCRQLLPRCGGGGEGQVPHDPLGLALRRRHLAVAAAAADRGASTPGPTRQQQQTLTLAVGAAAGTRLARRGRRRCAGRRAQGGRAAAQLLLQAALHEVGHAGGRRDGVRPTLAAARRRRKQRGCQAALCHHATGRCLRQGSQIPRRRRQRHGQIARRRARGAAAGRCGCRARRRQQVEQRVVRQLFCKGWRRRAEAGDAGGSAEAGLQAAAGRALETGSKQAAGSSVPQQDQYQQQWQLSAAAATRGSTPSADLRLPGSAAPSTAPAECHGQPPPARLRAGRREGRWGQACVPKRGV